MFNSEYKRKQVLTRENAFFTSESVKTVVPTVVKVHRA